VSVIGGHSNSRGRSKEKKKSQRGWLQAETREKRGRHVLKQKEKDHYSLRWNPRGVIKSDERGKFSAR